jgi:hypothetical protein
MENVHTSTEADEGEKRRREKKKKLMMTTSSKRHDGEYSSLGQHQIVNDDVPICIRSDGNSACSR